MVKDRSAKNDANGKRPSRLSLRIGPKHCHVSVWIGTSLTIDDAIDKAKKVELRQMSASNALQANVRLQQLEQQNFLFKSQIMQMQGQGTETPRPQGSAAQKK